MFLYCGSIPDPQSSFSVTRVTSTPPLMKTTTSPPTLNASVTPSLSIVSFLFLLFFFSHDIMHIYVWLISVGKVFKYLERKKSKFACNNTVKIWSYLLIGIILFKKPWQRNTWCVNETRLSNLHWFDWNGPGETAWCCHGNHWAAVPLSLAPSVVSVWQTRQSSGRSNATAACSVHKNSQ